MTPIPAVFDCVVFVQAMANQHGPAGASWELVCAGRVVVFTSEATLAELGDVLRRPKLASRLGITADAAQAFVDEVRRSSIVFDPVVAQFSFPRDPKDEPYLDPAIACQPSYLVLAMPISCRSPRWQPKRVHNFVQPHRILASFTQPNF